MLFAAIQQTAKLNLEISENSVSALPKITVGPADPKATIIESRAFIESSRK